MYSFTRYASSPVHGRLQQLAYHGCSVPFLAVFPTRLLSFMKSTATWSALRPTSSPLYPLQRGKTYTGFVLGTRL